MKSRKFSVLAGVCAAVALVAGCASTIEGVAQPNPQSVTAVQTSASAGPSATNSSAPSSTPESSVDTRESTASTPTLTSPTEETTETTTSSSVGPSSSGVSTSGSAGPTTYPSTPLQYDKTPSSAESANVLEGHRIAGYLVVPSLIDESYPDSASLSTFAFKGPAAMSTLFAASSMPSVAQRAGMITGFSSARHDVDNNGLLVAAFEFADPAKAKAAAPALAAAAADKSHDKGKAVIPGYAAAAGWYGAFDAKTPYFQAFLAQGSMVLYLYISGPKLKTAAQQAALAARVLAAETGAMSHYVPTPEDRLMQLPVDPQGLRAHTLPNSSDDATVNDGIFTAAGQLHFDTEPVKTKAIFDSAGVDLVSDGRAAVYRARDANGATLVQADFIASTQNAVKSMQPYQLASATKDTKCLQQALNSNYYCVGTVGRYAFEISAGSEADLDAAVTAQATLLAGA